MSSLNSAEPNKDGNNPITEVVAIAIKNKVNKKYLIFKRSKADSYEGYWEFPGGKVDLGETLVQALVREIDEELAVTVDPKKLVYVSYNEHQYPQKKIRLHLFLYEIEGEIEYKLIEHDEAVWVFVQDLSQYQLAPADIPFLKYL